MIMGANIGTTITNTLASLGHVAGVRSSAARSPATVHDFFNLLAVAVFLPLELVILLALGLAAIFLSLSMITSSMRKLVAGRVERAMNRLIGKGGGTLGLALGLVVTVMVRSSSITTSILVPMVAAGVLRLESAYPITLGANVGTTVTALIASLAVDLRAGLVIALVHTLFNIGGIIVFYPIPALRNVPLRLARGLADQAVERRTVVGAYTVGVFVIAPLVGIVILG